MNFDSPSRPWRPIQSFRLIDLLHIWLGPLSVQGEDSFHKNV